ncbi:MAG: hypothetical protein GF384_05255, partial [Elusimicrobia bacterium]|nr:hypothetical protein [Elusimicrobiota bacterium]
MKRKKILIALQSFGEFNNEPIGLLHKASFDIIRNTLKHRLNREEIIQLGNNCDGIVAGVEPYDEYVLNRLPQLSCISRCGVGIDNIDLELARKKNIKILNTPDAVIQPVAEMVIAMILCLYRNLIPQTNALCQSQWKKISGNLLYGKKAGIIGLGRIGKRVCEILKALGVYVSAYDVQPDEVWARQHDVVIHKNVLNLITTVNII